MPDRDLILRCLDELETELLRVGAEHCDHLRCCPATVESSFTVPFDGRAVPTGKP